MSDQRITPDPNSLLIRRSQGQIVVARGLWYVKPGQAEFRKRTSSPAFARRSARRDRIFRDQPRHGTTCRTRASAEKRMGANARAFADGRFSIPCQIRLLSRWRRHRRARQMDRQARLCIASASRQFPSRPKRTCCPFRQKCRRGVRYWQPIWKRRSTPIGMPARLQATVFLSSEPASSGCWSPTCATRIAGTTCDDHRRRPGPRAATPKCSA